MAVLNKALNFLIAVVNAILLIFNVSAANSATPEIDLDNDYNLVWQDEFDQGTLDTTKWRQHNSEGVRKGGYWTMNMASVDGENLIIKTEYQENGKFGPGWYTAGICTQDKYERKYGYYECRCKLAKGQGLWSAFWLTNSNVTNLTTGNAKQGAEIDVFESPFWLLGGTMKNKITSNIHYNGYELLTRYGNVGIFQLDNDPYENFNTYGVEWTEDEYIFYINGHEVGRSSFGGVSEADEYMILSCEVDGADHEPSFGWSGNIEYNSEGKEFTSEFVVDYVRVYEPIEE